MNPRSLACALATTCALSFSGCNTGDISVDASGPAAIPAAAPSAQNSGGSKQNLTPGAEASTIIYFETTRTDETGNMTILGIGNQELDAAVYGDSESPFKAPQELRSYPLFSPVKDGFIYLYRSLFAKDTLVANGHTLYTFARRVRTMAIDPSGKHVAWSEDDGKIYAADLPLGDPEEVASVVGENAIGVQEIRWDSSGTRILVRSRAAASKASAWTALRIDGAWSAGWASDDAEAAAFSPDGNEIAFVSADGTVRVTDAARESGPTTSARIVGSIKTDPSTSSIDALHDFAWTRGSLATFWVAVPNGQAGQDGKVNEVRSLDLEGGDTKAIARLSVPDAVGDGMICPVFTGDAVLFADQQQGQYVIMKASETGEVTSTPAVFAQPDSEDMGFVCPQL